MFSRSVTNSVWNASVDTSFQALSLLPSPASNGRIEGWIQSPNIRGTWEILWTSLATIFLCTHTFLCLNVPATDDTTTIRVLRRMKWMLIATLAPEIVLAYAAGQWSRARRAVNEFHYAGYTQWNMRLSFFADMGGFTLVAADRISFPLNAKQLLWLVTNGVVEHPRVTEDEIWYKSKQDRTTKAITVVQIGYFVIQCMGRVAQHLPLTTLELFTLALVLCSLLTAATWLRKPADVQIPIRLQTHLTTAELACGNTWRQTPLDFVDANMPGWSMNVQPFMGLPTISADRPIQRIPNDRFPTNPYGAQEYLLCLATLVFTGIHVIGWNFSFPSTGEQLFWRICSVALFSVTASFWILETIASWVRLDRWRWLHLRLFHPKQLPRFEKYIRERVLAGTRDLVELPQAWEFWTIAPIAVLYGLARVYLVTEAFVELRSLQPEAYVTTNWQIYIPHI